MSAAYYAQDNLYETNSFHEDDSSSVTSDDTMSTLDIGGRQNKSRKSYPSGAPGTFIYDAETGSKTTHKVGSRDEHRYFKVTNSIQENSTVFFYTSPDRYCRHNNIDTSYWSQLDQDNWSNVLMRWHNNQTMIRNTSNDTVPDSLCTFTQSQLENNTTAVNNVDYVPPIRGSPYNGESPNIIGAYYQENMREKRASDSFTHHRGNGLAQHKL